MNSDDKIIKTIFHKYKQFKPRVIKFSNNYILYEWSPQDFGGGYNTLYGLFSINNEVLFCYRDKEFFYWKKPISDWYNNINSTWEEAWKLLGEFNTSIKNIKDFIDGLLLSQL